MRDVVAAAEPRAVVAALVAIGVSLAVGLPVTLTILRWICSRLRLEVLLRKNPPGENDRNDDASVSGLFVHPVKSLKSISLSESTIDQKGLTLDRRFMVIYELPLPVYKTQWGPNDATHRFLTQRQCPSLATLSATITTAADGNGKVLVLEQKVSGKNIRIPLNSQNDAPPNRSRYLAGIWDDVVAVDDLGDAAAAFLQAIADSDDELAASTQGGSGNKVVRLVTESSQPLPFPGKDERSYVPAFAKTWNGGFLGKPTLTDGFPVLIASEASLDDLNQKLSSNGKEPIPMSRFRPNIVVRGKSLEPFEEDRWKVIAIGDVVFAIVKACPRCKQSCTDQTTGIVSDEPLATMKKFRRSSGDSPPGGDVFFAQNAIPIGRLKGKTIRVGDPVRILETGEPVFL